MARNIFSVSIILLALAIAGCGSAAGTTTGGGNGGGGTPQDIPTLASIAPSAAALGTSGINLVCI